LIKLPELHAKLEEQMGIILCPPEWFNHDPALRIELLDDWVYGLRRLRDATEVERDTDEAIRKAMKK
jgi:hypothetical protein